MNLDTTPTGPLETYRPLPSLGWLWSAALAVLSVSSLIVPAWAVAVDPEPVPAWVWVMLLAMGVPLGTLFITLTVLHTTMRYEIHPSHLALRFGPILHYRLPWTEIAGIEQKDLKVQMWSSMRWPGLALYGVPYSGIGTVKMCSTRVNRGVVLITMQDGKHYGVSPAEPDRFISSVTARVRTG